MSYQRLSVVIPVFNERNTVGEAIRQARTADIPLDRQIVVVDDGSTDGTRDIIARFADSTVRPVYHDWNRGKGAAVRTGLEHVTGDLVVVFDADLEYDPRDWNAMLTPILEGKAQAVYGSRFTGQRRNMLFWHMLGNKFLSLVTNVLYNTTISDMETCSKMIDTELMRSLDLRASGFDIEPEITAKLLRKGIRVWEVPISYAGREIDEGKKITWRDGIPALWTLFKYRVVK